MATHAPRVQPVVLAPVRNAPAWASAPVRPSLCVELSSCSQHTVRCQVGKYESTTSKSISCTGARPLRWLIGVVLEGGPRSERLTVKVKPVSTSGQGTLLGARGGHPYECLKVRPRNLEPVVEVAHTETHGVCPICLVVEMRTIVANLFRRFSFSLSEPYRDENLAGPLEVALGTCGPRDVTPQGLQESAERCRQGMAPKHGMWLHVTRRTPDGGANKGAGTRGRL